MTNVDVHDAAPPAHSWSHDGLEGDASAIHDDPPRDLSHTPDYLLDAEAQIEDEEAWQRQRALELLDAHYEIFDSAYKNKVDGIIGDVDLEAIASGELTATEIRERLVEQGYETSDNGQEWEPGEFDSQMQEAAQWLLNNEGVFSEVDTRAEATLYRLDHAPSTGTATGESDSIAEDETDPIALGSQEANGDVDSEIGEPVAVAPSDLSSEEVDEQTRELRAIGQVLGDALQDGSTHPISVGDEVFFISVRAEEIDSGSRVQLTVDVAGEELIFDSDQPSAYVIEGIANNLQSYLSLPSHLRDIVRGKVQFSLNHQLKLRTEEDDRGEEETIRITGHYHRASDDIHYHGDDISGRKHTVDHEIAHAVAEQLYPDILFPPGWEEAMANDPSNLSNYHESGKDMPKEDFAEHWVDYQEARLAGRLEWLEEQIPGRFALLDALWNGDIPR